MDDKLIVSLIIIFLLKNFDTVLQSPIKNVKRLSQRLRERDYKTLVLVNLQSYALAKIKISFFSHASGT